MGWLPSNNTCSTLSSQSALSTSSKGFVEQKWGGGGAGRPRRLIGHRGGKLGRGSQDRGGPGWWGYQAIPGSFQDGFVSFASSKGKENTVR